MKYLSLENILVIHAFVVSETGGSQGIRDLGRLESVIASQNQNVFGKDVYVGLFNKSAALIRGIISDHAFVDGNKRTGMLVGLTFLKMNDTKLEFKIGEIEEYAIKIATGKLSVEEISKWLKSKAV